MCDQRSARCRPRSARQVATGLRGPARLRGLDRHLAADRPDGAFIITAVALAVVLAGNIVEFGIWGDGPVDSQDPGAAIFSSGLLILMFGLVFLRLAIVRSAWGRSGR